MHKDLNSAQVTFVDRIWEEKGIFVYFDPLAPNAAYMLMGEKRPGLMVAPDIESAIRLIKRLEGRE